jgi:hypothetical protein
VYQIDLTIDRWLKLGANELLELERGEDIDPVVRAIGGDEEAGRTLEQVKYRDRSVTLRSQEVVEAIANAVKHFGANKDLTLTVQFTTNAVPGIERPSPIPKRIPGILALENVRLRRLTDADAEGILTANKTLLAGRPKPDAISDSSWKQFRAIIETSDRGRLYCHSTA